MQTKVFDELLAPLTAFCSNAGAKIDKESKSKVLFFADFVRILVFSSSIGVPSLRQLILELSTNTSAKNLLLPAVAYSTFRDGFSRFNILVFNDLYQYVLQSFTWLQVPELEHLGLLKAVDGSLFPVLRSMEWAEYKRNFKAVKLHLAFNLNTACPNEFLLTKGNESERSFLTTIVQRGVTYICDRGYFSFDILKAMNKTGALFVLRLKKNHQFTVGAILHLTGDLPVCFYQVKDDLVRFNNDKDQKVYRIVRFRVQKSVFIICTNRLDLTTLQVILLYAYRWQIELIFKFLKRTLKGLHLFAQTERSSQVHFYMLLITALLQLRLKQLFLMTTLKNKPPHTATNVKSQLQHIRDLTNVSVPESYLGDQPHHWFNSINTIFNKCFKLSANWLLYLKNLIDKTIDYQLIILFNTM